MEGRASRRRLRGILLSEVVENLIFVAHFYRPHVLFGLHPANGPMPILSSAPILSDQFVRVAPCAIGANKLDARCVDKLGIGG